MTTKLEDSNAAPKTCWVILNRLLCNKTSLLYHLYTYYTFPDRKKKKNFVDGSFISDYCKKANLFNNSFVSTCTPIKNNSLLPLALYKTNTRISSFRVTNKGILSILKSLDSSKSHGYDNISVKMIKTCCELVTIPLKSIHEESLKKEYLQKYGKRLI